MMTSWKRGGSTGLRRMCWCVCVPLPVNKSALVSCTHSKKEVCLTSIWLASERKFSQSSVISTFTIRRTTNGLTWTIALSVLCFLLPFLSPLSMVQYDWHQLERWVVLELHFNWRCHKHYFLINCVCLYLEHYYIIITNNNYASWWWKVGMWQKTDWFELLHI